MNWEMEVHSCSWFVKSHELVHISHWFRFMRFHLNDFSKLCHYHSVTCQWTQKAFNYHLSSLVSCSAAAAWLEKKHLKSSHCLDNWSIGAGMAHELNKPPQKTWRFTGASQTMQPHKLGFANNVWVYNKFLFVNWFVPIPSLHYSFWNVLKISFPHPS